MLDLRLYMLQRISAVIMIPLVFAHLAMMIYAIRGGLDASEILSRTYGSTLWFCFYASFVVAASVHGAIGLRAIVHEWLGFNGMPLRITMWAAGLVLAALGMRAVWAVTFGSVMS